MIRSLDSYRRLDRRQRAGVRSALRQAMATRRVLNDAGYEAAREFLDDSPNAFPDSHDRISDAILADRAIRAFPRRLVCLERSLVVEKIAGSEAEIRFGVSTSEGYRFHAWVEMDGIVLNDLPNIASEFAIFSGGAVGGSDLSRFK